MIRDILTVYSSQINIFALIFSVYNLWNQISCFSVFILSKPQLCNRITGDSTGKINIHSFFSNILVNRQLSHLAVCDSVVVDPHLWVDMFKIPAETPTLQPLPQGQALRDIPEIYPWVLSTNGAKQRREDKQPLASGHLT